MIARVLRLETWLSKCNRLHIYTETARRKGYFHLIISYTYVIPYTYLYMNTVAAGVAAAVADVSSCKTQPGLEVTFI